CRIAYAESVRFPELGTLVREQSRHRFVKPLCRHVMEAQRDGDIMQGDPALLSQLILVSSFAFPFLGALLRGADHASIADREAYFDRIWRLIGGRVDAATGGRRRKPRRNNSASRPVSGP